MADKKSPRTPLVLSPEALFRYQIVSAVKARELSGQPVDAAVRAVAAQHHQTITGEHKTAASVRSTAGLPSSTARGPAGSRLRSPSV